MPKKAYVSLLGLIGLIVLLVGLFLHVYDFMLGLIIAIVLWIGSGILARYWGVKKGNIRKLQIQAVTSTPEGCPSGLW
jgi:uncharacterized membrane protein